MRIVMLGTGPFAVPTLAALLDSPHEVLALVTRPTPPPKGREKQSLNPMRDLAEARGLPVLAPPDVNAAEFREQLHAWRADLWVVCDYGQILAREVLAAAPLGGINLHGSLLPKYRGAAPIQRAMLAGDAETGVAVIHMTPRLDGGPILALERTPIGPEETAAELEQRLAQIGASAVLKSLDLLASWDRLSPLGALQDKALVTKAPRLSKTEGEVDWSRSAQAIHNQVRALKPWPTTYSHWLRDGGEPLRLILDRVRVVRPEEIPPDIADLLPASPAGAILLGDGRRLWLNTGDGVLALEAVQPSGKRVLEITEFLRGYPVKAGQRFGSLSSPRESEGN